MDIIKKSEPAAVRLEKTLRCGFAILSFLVVFFGSLTAVLLRGH